MRELRRLQRRYGVGGCPQVVDMEHDYMYCPPGKPFSSPLNPRPLAV